MKVLFFLFHGFSDTSGITKKVLGQVKGLRNNSVDVDLGYYDILDDGRRCWVIGEKPVVSLGKGVIGKLRKRIDFRSLSKYIVEQKYQLIYIRSFHNANPFTISFVKSLRKLGAKILLEIPTYPYDLEYQGWKDQIPLLIDQIFRKRLVRYVDTIVTFSDDNYIFEKKTIQISNGIDFDVVNLHQKVVKRHDEVHLIVVAEIHYWHGIDRIIEAIAAYNSSSHDTKFFLHIVGDYFSDREKREIEGPINEYHLNEFIVRYGSLYGEDLNAVFNKCDFAIGSLGRHRTGISRMRSLKNREYAARGIAFAYAESDPDFDNSPYVIRFTPDESKLNLEPIISYLESSRKEPEEIRDSIRHLSWTNQMKVVLQALNEL